MQLATKTPMRKYESVIILHPDTSEEEQKNFFKKNQDILKQFDGEFGHVDTWGKRRLANPVERLKVGIYFHTTFEAKAGVVAELERTMRINDKVLRFMHTKLDDRQPLSKHIENYREVIKMSIQREQEKESKAAARRAAVQKKFKGR